MNATHLMVHYTEYTPKMKEATRIVEHPIVFEYRDGTQYLKQDKHCKLPRIRVEDITAIYFADLSY